MAFGSFEIGFAQYTDRTGHSAEADIFEHCVGNSALHDLVSLRAKPAAVHTNIVDDAIHLPVPGNAFEMLLDRHAVGKVDGFHAVWLEKVQPLLNVIGNDDGACTQKSGAGGTRSADRPGTEDQDVFADDVGRRGWPVWASEPMESCG